MKNTLILCITMFILVSTGMADETASKFYVGARGGISTYAGDIEEYRASTYYDLSAGFWFTKSLALGFNYGKGFLQASDTKYGPERYFKTWMWEYTFLLKFKLMPSSALNPYLTVGYTFMDIDPKGRNNTRLPNRAANVYDKMNWAIPAGIGFSYFLSETFAVDFEALYHHSGTDYLDDLKAGTKNDGWTTAAVGLSLYLGKALDRDGDNIPDRRDADPNHAEDFDGFEDQDGAPDPDNDHDGIMDLTDGAPLEPEDQDGFRDGDGIPDPDNDGDGIEDSRDQCPGTDKDLATVEDMDGFQDDDGCPDSDNDNDGIADTEDQCPNEAETPNDYQDEDGCPDEKPEIAVEAGQAIVLEGVTFNSGSAELTPNSRIILNKVVQTMKENPQIEVEIRGYTDNTGSNAANMRISLQRADAVKSYLVQNGIDAFRITTRGFGPANPVASNDTREGRARNRRIEFYRIK